MDREVLKAYLESGLSLTEIGTLTDRDPSTVGYWVQKHGLTANGRAKYAPRGGLTLEQLEPLVESGATVQEIADALGRSVSTVRHWLRRYGLKTRNRRGRRPGHDREKIKQALASGNRTLSLVCRKHGTTEFIIENSGRVRCKRCRQQRVVEWRRRVKRRLVTEAGGACRLCGYDACHAALEFHHVDPKTKSFGLATNGVTRSIMQLREEAAKCVLLCANCHAEVESGVATLS